MSSSSNGAPPRPGSARLSVLVGLLAAATMPAAIVATRWSRDYELMDAGFAIPLAALLGLLAVALARRARSRLAPTLGHPRGTRTARLGRILGLLGFLLALTGAGSLAVYWILSLVETYDPIGHGGYHGAVFEIGNSLREARLRRHIDFSDAEHGTKIRGKYLRALEDERFELLPSHTYIKGFLRSYAEYLGLDGQLYVDEYNSRFVIGEEDAPVPGAARAGGQGAPSDRRESNIVLLALTAIALVTALVIVAWRFGGPEDEPVHGLTTSAKEQRPAVQVPQAAGTARVELRATRGDSYLLVKQGSAPRRDPLPGDARAGPEAALRRAGPLGPARVAAERARPPQRQPGAPAGSRQGAGRLRDREEDLRGRRGLSSANGRRPRAVIVVTGSELVRGERTDLNGPFLARSLLALGVEPSRIHVVGDDPAELEAAVRRSGRERRSRRHLGRARPDARRPHGRDRRARSQGWRFASTRSWRRRSRASRGWSPSG